MIPALLELLVAQALAADPQSLRAPIREIDHPRYADAAGTPLTWAEVQQLAAPTDALREVRRRRLGRTLVRVMFLSATAAESWGTVKLAQREPDQRWPAYLLGAQTGLTGLCAVLSITSAPQSIVEDRAIVLRGANQAMLRR